MIGFELKAIVVIALIATIIYNAVSYSPVDSKTFGNDAPSMKSIILLILSLMLFIYGIYLNDNPIILF